MTTADLTTAAMKPPVRPLSARLVDVLVWGGVAVLLIVSFGPVDMAHLPRGFTKSQNMQQFGQEFAQADFTHWQTYISQMWLTIQIALWGTFLAVVIAVPFGLACSRNLSPIWLQQPMRMLMNVLRSIPDLVIGTLFIVAVFVTQGLEMWLRAGRLLTEARAANGGLA